MKRLIVLMAILGVVGAACGRETAGSLGAPPAGEPSESASPTTDAPPASPSPSPASTPSPSDHAGTVTYEVWFVYSGKLFVGSRTEPFTQAVAGLALQRVLAGPSSAERAAAVRTAIPAGISGRIASLSNGVATVALDAAFFDGAAADVRLRQAQVVYTLTQYDTIAAVRFSNGATATARDDYEDELPPILVEDPHIGETVSSPVAVSGTSNVFEGTVSLRILDASGTEIARTFTTATCGSGCRGDYSASVSYRVDHEQRGVIVVYESSVKDGSAIHVVRIPVTLTP